MGLPVSSDGGADHSNNEGGAPATASSKSLDSLAAGLLFVSLLSVPLSFRKQIISRQSRAIPVHVVGR
jgi:hypothetical protein